MKRSLLSLLGVVLCVSIALPQAPSAKQRPLVLTHVTVIDTTGAPAQPDVTVVIRGDRIVGMGKSGKVPVPAGSQVVNAAGKFLIPGLWDMNVLWYEPDYLPLFIANGVTGVRMTIGYAENHEWRKEVEAGQLLGPHMVIGTRWIEGPEPIASWYISVANEGDARQAVVKAQEYGADFVELGGSEDLSRDAFLALADEAKKRGIPFEGALPVSVSVEEASQAGMKSIDEQPSMFGIEMVLAACSSRETDLLKSWQVLASQERDDWETFWEGPSYRAPMQLALETYDQQKAEALFAVLRTNHTWVSPTLTARRNSTFWLFASDPRRKYMSANERNWFNRVHDTFSKTSSPELSALRQRVYEKDLAIVGAMRRAGVEFLAGTTTEDPTFAVPGFSLHDELALLVQAGHTPMEALQAATLNPARFLGREHDFGTVAAGKIADLVLLDANPLADISNTRKIAAVVQGGKLFPRAALDGMLAKIEALAGRKDIGDMLEPTIKEKGVEATIRQYRELKSTQPDSYDFGNMYSLKRLGDQLLDAKKFKDAIQIFELNAEAFPRWWWTYNSLGNAYLEAGEKELAIKNYKKSLQLDPANQNAAVKLKQLNSE